MWKIKDLPSKWLLVIIGGHTAWATYPVLARYLQIKSMVPTFMLASAANLLLFLLLLIFVLPKIKLSQFKSRLLWTFSGIVILRSVTNILSVRYTMAINVQMVNLLTPFIVVIINSGYYHIKAPQFTGIALTLSLGGAAMMILGKQAGSGVALSLSSSDLLGISLAVVSSFFLALYVIYMGRIMARGIEDKTILSAQAISLMLVMGIISLVLKEDPSCWFAFRLADWAAFLSFVLIALLGASWAQIQALKHVNSTLVSSAMAWRLVITSIAGLLILGEKLVSAWQYLGAAIVIVTITWYLGKQVPRNGVAAAGAVKPA